MLKSLLVSVLLTAIASCTSKVESDKNLRSDSTTSVTLNAADTAIPVPPSGPRPIEDTARNRMLTHCQVHGDSLIHSVVRADFLVGATQDSSYLNAGRRLFPNTRNILLPNGADKGVTFKRCPSCDSVWKAYSRLRTVE